MLGSLGDSAATGLTEIGLEEISERWCGCGLGPGNFVGIPAGSGGLEEDWCIDLESFDLWVLQLASRELPSSFEGMASDHQGMSMVCSGNERGAYRQPT